MSNRPATDQPDEAPAKDLEPGHITTRQMRRLHALLRDHGITGDAGVHSYLETALGRPVPSRSELSNAEAARVIAELEAAPLPAAPLPPGANIAAALVEVQKALPLVRKTKTAQVPTKAGGSYSYTYADLADVTDAAMPLLTANGLAFSCAPRAADRGYELVGTLLHVSGETREGALPLHGNDMQAMGGGITYARRYLLGCLIGLVTDDDPDARPAQGTSRTQQWDGPTTAALLNQIDADAQRAGVTYEQATAKFRERQSLTLDQLDALEPWILAPLAKAVKDRADEMEREAAQKDPSDGKDPWAGQGAQA